MKTVTRNEDGSWTVTRLVKRIWAKNRKRDEDGKLVRVKLQEPVEMRRSEKVVRRRSTLRKMGINPFRTGTVIIHE